MTAKLRAKWQVFDQNRLIMFHMEKSSWKKNRSNSKIFKLKLQFQGEMVNEELMGKVADCFFGD